MKKVFLSFVVIVVFCGLDLAFAQETTQSETVEPSKQADEPSPKNEKEQTLKKSDEPSPQNDEEQTLKKSDESSPRKEDEMSTQQADEPASEEANEPASQKADEPAPKKSDEPSLHKADESASEEADEPASGQADAPSLQKANVATVQQAGEMPQAIKVVDVEPYYYCALEMTGSYDQHGTGFNTLYEQAGIQNLPQNQPPFGIYFNDPGQTPEEELKWELGLVLPDSSQVAEPLKLKKWEFNRVVTRMYDGVFGAEEMGQVFVEMYAWIGQNKYTTAGPLLERYLSQMEQNAKGEWMGKVEIWIPVQKAE